MFRRMLKNIPKAFPALQRMSEHLADAYRAARSDLILAGKSAAEAFAVLRFG